MAAQTLSEYFIEYRNGVNPVTGEQRLYKDITDQMIWDAAIKAAEEKFNPSNNGIELTLPPQFPAYDAFADRICSTCGNNVFNNVKGLCTSCKVTLSNFVPLANTTER